MTFEPSIASWLRLRAARAVIVLVLIAAGCAAVGGQQPSGWSAAAQADAE